MKNIHTTPEEMKEVIRRAEVVVSNLTPWRDKPNRCPICGKKLSELWEIPIINV